MKLVALISGGKDSWFAAYKASKEHELACLISIKSKNPDSYMFHTPNIDLVEMQASAANLPLITQKTKGEKEKELKDLKKAIEKAKKQYKIQGIVTGALFSNYQKERIENICKELGLEMISPLWHTNQLNLLSELLENKFEVIISSIAAYGLTEKWLGRKIDKDAIEELEQINKKISINIAFEGGEAESLVLNCPLFKKRIVIKEAEKTMENEHTGYYKITKSELT